MHVDVVRKKGKVRDLVQVKARSYDPDRSVISHTRGDVDSGWMPCLVDITFQTHVARTATKGTGSRSEPWVSPRVGRPLAVSTVARELPGGAADDFRSHGTPLKPFGSPHAEDRVRPRPLGP